MLIEQAIFASAETDRGSGYQLLAASPGLDPVELRDLTAFGPSHDSLVDTSQFGRSVNFHPLPTGRYCLSRSVATGQEYSQRGGQSVYTQCLVVPPEVLGRFSNNPFALLKAAYVQGEMEVHKEVPERLEPFKLVGGASAVDRSALSKARDTVGPQWMAVIVDSALSSERLAICAVQHREEIIEILLNCLPQECRPLYSFSTGLKFSSRRSFNWMCLDGDRTEQRRAERGGQMTALELTPDPRTMPPDPDWKPKSRWSRLIGTVLATGRTSFLNAQLGKRRPGVSPSDLDSWGARLLEQLAITEHDGPAPNGRADVRSIRSRPPVDPPRRTFDEPEVARMRGTEPLNSPLRATMPAPARTQLSGGDPDGARATARGQASAADQTHELATILGNVAAASGQQPKPSAPSVSLQELVRMDLPTAERSAEVVEHLELLDDTVFDAIAGKAGAIERLNELWPQMERQVDPALIEESRAAYLRHALEAWQICQESGATRDPEMALRVMDVVSLLLNYRGLPPGENPRLPQMR